jgi:glycosyltransferase involved in cell wall biosynthesis
MSLVSIILPTYNRINFLPSAFTSLLQQTHQDWELIIVDDGSDDGSEAVIAEYQSKLAQPCLYIKQENAGPAKARNTGILKAKGDYVAFFDSDDTWDDEHLASAVAVLDSNDDIDWIYFACRRVQLNDNFLLCPSTFYTQDKQNILFDCVKEKRGDVCLLDNPLSSIAQIKIGIDSGLQNSVIRHNVFKKHLLPDFRIGEDRLFISQALKSNFTLAFVDKVTVTYFVHEQNTSDTNVNSVDIEKRVSAMTLLLESYEQSFDLLVLNKLEKKALKHKLSEDYFWKLGYALHAQNKQYKYALKAMTKGVYYNPYRLKYYKSVLATLLKYLFHKVTI